MRTTYLICYDICDDKRLRKVFKTCKDYGEHLQYSIFECDLNDRELAELEGKLLPLLNQDEDLPNGRTAADLLHASFCPCSIRTKTRFY